MPGPEDGEVPLGEVTDPVTPDYHFAFLRQGDRLVIRTRRDATGTAGRRELPLAAAAWLHAAITKGFWRAAEDGGYGAKTTHVEAEIGAERLELRRSWGLGGPDGLGFTLTNHGRLTARGYPEELAFTDELLIEGGLLDLLAAIATPC